MVVRAAFTVFFVSSAVAGLAFTLLQGGPAGGGLRWLGAPILAVAILLSMGCLVAFTGSIGGRAGRARTPAHRSK